MFRIFVNVQAEPREVRYDRCLARRTLIKPLENFVQFCRFVFGAIKLAKIVERFTPHGRIFFDARPELLGLIRQLPFRGEPGERKFMFRLVA
jgi:hypothetical protein